MTAYLLLNHLLNFILPALVVAVMLALGARLWPGSSGKKSGFIQQISAHIAINFVACALVLVGGLLVFGHDGRMLTYLALVLVAALAQWCQLRGWKR